MSDGSPGPWVDERIEIVAQRGEGLDERLASAFEELPGPALIIGMDTPQVSSRLLECALGELVAVDSVLGPAADGGYWAIGLRAGDPRAVVGVPMSSPHTLAAQRLRLHTLGHAVRELPTLRDVDTYADAMAVAIDAPETAFARAFAAIGAMRAAA